MATVAETRPRPRAWRDVLEGRRALASALIAPAVVFIALLVGGPLLLSIYLAFTDATAGSLRGAFVGFENFAREWDDPNFQRAFRNTFIFTFVSQAIVVLGASVLAHFLIQPFRGRWILRFLVLLPWAAPVALGAIGWLWIFDSLFSVINWTLVHDILPGGGELYPYKIVNFLLADHIHVIAPIDPFVVPQWLGQPRLAMASVILAHAWRLLPFATVIMIAGLASIPTEVQDAAKVDGATGLKKIWYVTLPLQLPIATVAVLFGIVFTATDMAVVKVLTNGGPFNQTQMLTTWAFSTGIESSSLGAGAAVSLFMLPILAAVTILMLLFARRVEVS